jgi:hypothetical protein
VGATYAFQLPDGTTFTCKVDGMMERAGAPSAKGAEVLGRVTWAGGPPPWPGEERSRAKTPTQH